MPLLKGGDGRQGWDVIRDRRDEAEEGDTLDIDMNGSVVVPGDVLRGIKGKDITMTFDLGNGILWSVNGKSVTAEGVSDVDFSAAIGTEAIPADIVKNVAGERGSVQLSLSNEGEFGFTAALSVSLDKKNAGLYANLFRYNESAGELEWISANEIASDGTVSLSLTHAYDYVIVMDKEPMEGGGSEDTGVEAGETDLSEDGNNDSASGSGDTEIHPENQSWNIVWTALIIVVVTAAGLAMFFVWKKKKGEGQ